jgi:hypothetical protein
MKYWLVNIPYRGTGTIPIKSEKEPHAFDSEISSKLHTGFIDESWPQFFRNEAEVEECDEDMYNRTFQLIQKKKKRKAAIIDAVVKGAL